MANRSFLDNNGVLYLWNKIKGILPTKVSELTNDAGYLVEDDLPEQTPASSTSPKMNGMASAGIEAAYSRGDHVHPADTTKVDKVEGMGLSHNDYTTDEKTKLGGVSAGATKTEASDTNGSVKVDGQNVQVYTLPDAAADTKGGVKVGSNVDVSGGTISVKDGTTAAKGVVKLNSATNSDDETTAATPAAVKAAMEAAAAKQSPATSIAGYGITDAYTKDEIDGMVSSAMHYKGTKATYADLPTTGNKAGDVWNIEAADAEHGVNAGDNVAWNSTSKSWDVLAGTLDLSAYQLASDLTALTNSEIDEICK